MSDDTKALVERLRLHDNDPTCTEAADAIEHLLTEYAKVQRLWKEAAIDASGKYDTIGGLENAYKQLEHDRDALAERCEKLERGVAEVVELFSDERSGDAFQRLLSLAAPKEAP